MKKLKINVNELSYVGKGRTTPFRFEDKLLKLRELPKWSVFDEAREYREENEILPIDVEREHKGVWLAKFLGVYTPATRLLNAELEDGGKTFSTPALLREWMDGPQYVTFSSLEGMNLVLPKRACHRLEFMYIVLCDFVLGNWDRTARNLIYDRDIDTLIPIDYENAFDYDRVPASVEGFERVLSEFLFEPDLSGVLTMSPAILMSTWSYIMNNANYSLIERIDKELPYRMITLDYPLRMFARKYRLGFFNAPKTTIAERTSNAEDENSA